MIKYKSLLIILFTFLGYTTIAQTDADSTDVNKEFTSLEEALKNPQKVYRLNLSNQAFQIPDSAWLKFTNLQYLSLKNDHLKQIPDGIGYVKTLKVLDLSGNDFKVLPPTFVNLINLQELFINDDKYFNLDKNMDLLSSFPKLNSLHIENVGLKSLPESLFKLERVESLYLNNNQFKEFPIELNGLKRLKYVDIHDNKFMLPTHTPSDQGFGFRIRF